ncbi:MAG: hypothetical protein IJW22_08190 [Clostridia bacterium]|nr:hypothetical protein [Clostridia bacterium]
MKRKLILYVPIVVFLVAFFAYYISNVLLVTRTQNTNPNYSGLKYQKLDEVGTPPPEFEAVVAENLFYRAKGFENAVITYEEAESENTYTVRLFDLYGNLRFSVLFESEFQPKNVLATSDGGMLLCDGFRERYLYGEEIWASELGVVSYLYKYDASGMLEWKKTLEGYHDRDFVQSIEGEDAYYFFGERETPETKKLGVSSPCDVCVTKIGKDGSVLKTDVYGGSGYDEMWCAEKIKNGFAIYCESESDDFGKGELLELRISTELELKRVKRPLLFKDEPVGVLDGEPANGAHKRLENFDGGYITTILDYDQFYLVISENATGRYEDQPGWISHVWEYTETVYSAYDKKDNLLWRATVDSSPDFDAKKKEIEENTEWVEVPEE